MLPQTTVLRLFLFHMVAKTIARKKNPKIRKEELLNLLRQGDTVEQREFNIQNIIAQREAIDIIKRYEEEYE